MPELPEVESVRRSLAPHLVGTPILRALLHRQDIVDGPRDPRSLLEGATVVSLERRGKQLAIVTSCAVLVVQLGMTGQLLFMPHAPPDPPDPRAPKPANEPPPELAAVKHTHALWQTSRGWMVFRDPRRFGGLATLPDDASLRARWAALGPDGLSVTGQELAAALCRSARAIKPALLDQAAVAGVGNIYADESLHLAGIAPTRKCLRIKASEFQRLADAIRGVLARAVAAGGSTLKDYVDADGRRGSYVASHAVYGRGGEPCVTCAAPLEQRVIGQRTTVWCRICQPRTAAKRPSS